MPEFNDRVIAEFRANGGRVDIGGFGTNLVAASRGLRRLPGVRWITAAADLPAATPPTVGLRSQV